MPSADLPLGMEIGKWVAFGDAQTGQLDKANDRTKSAIEIVSGCEARDRAQAARATRPWWHLWP